MVTGSSPVGSTTITWRNTQEAEGIGLENRQVMKVARGFKSLFLRHLYIAGWSSLVARRAHNPEVVGSNPSSATNWSRGVAVITSACHAEDREFDSRRDRHFFYFGSVAQSVEQGTENPCVGGSIPPRGTTNRAGVAQ